MAPVVVKIYDISSQPVTTLEEKTNNDPDNTNNIELVTSICANNISISDDASSVSPPQTSPSSSSSSSQNERQLSQEKTASLNLFSLGRKSPPPSDTSPSERYDANLNHCNIKIPPHSTKKICSQNVYIRKN